MFYGCNCFVVFMKTFKKLSQLSFPNKKASTSDTTNSKIRHKNLVIFQTTTVYVIIAYALN